jgi:diguanylate cyclase
MIPTVADICSKQVVTIDLEATFGQAINEMSNSNERTILVTDKQKVNSYYLISAGDAIEFKIQNISLDTKMAQLNLREIQTIDAKINVLELLQNQELLKDYLLVLSHQKIIGILSQTDIINNIDPKILIERQSIGTLILQYIPVNVLENDTTLDIIKLMKFKKIDSVIIVDEERAPTGIFTTKDFLNILQGNKDLSLPIKEYMTSPLQTVNENAKISEVLDFIKERQFKRVVVSNDSGKIIGVITQNEILRLLNNKWMELIKERGEELSKINEKLIKNTSSLEESASKDYLTNLYNRRKFNTVINYEISQIKRHKQRNLSIILLDIDDFKAINDTYGHDIGDKVLIDIAKILQISSRDSDIISRWGGEEFVIALPETSIERGLIVAEKIRKSIEYFIFPEDIQITSSLGIAQFHTTDDFDSLFKRADDALLRAKRYGKNKIELESI